MEYRLRVRLDADKVWVVTSDDIPGLLVVSKNPREALGQVPDAIDDLRKARVK